ncbi:hypothetical protein [Ornithinibacillus xuwenensis]|uniref:Lipoprotein n=1 Tax=Ornithinibacillus xuwenensis TaxID=3144668 RepID=A0ABU9XGP0_9BACI
MNKNKFLYIALSMIIIVVLAIWFLNMTSKSTTFKEMLEEQIRQDEQLTITNLDYDRIHQISIEGPTGDEIEIDDKDVISDLLGNELHIDKGGKYKESKAEYDLYIHFYGSIHRYTIAEDYIKTFDGNYKVLDEDNEVFNYFTSLYGGK